MRQGMSWLATSVTIGVPVTGDVGELVFSGELPPDASIIDCLRVAWGEARSEANCAYELWHAERGADAYIVYRAAQDRADAAQDAFAQLARQAR
jgi:hypothetical protein